MKNFRYLILILIFACKDSTLIPDKDCAGVIGGEAVIDDCGYCTGGNTKVTFNQMLGCDALCSGSKFDINGTCCPISDWDCNGVCTGSDTLDCQSICNGKAYLFESGVDDWIDVNLNQEIDEGDYYYDNSLIKMYDIDLVDSLDNPCCFIDMCNVCDLDEANDCVPDCTEIEQDCDGIWVSDSDDISSGKCWGGSASSLNDCGVCIGGNTGLENPKNCLGECSAYLNKVWDEGEIFSDIDLSGTWEPAEKFIDVLNGIWDDGEEYSDVNNNGEWNEGEFFIDALNGIWDDGEEFSDSNGNGIWDDDEPLSDGLYWVDNCGVCDILIEAEPFIDLDGDKVWDDNEAFIDCNFDQSICENNTEDWNPQMGNGLWDEGEIFSDIDSSGTWTPAEIFTDLNSNGKYDKGPNSSCNKDCSLELECDGTWEIDYLYKRMNPGVKTSEFPDSAKGCWNGPKVEDKDFNETPSPENCCYPYSYTDQENSDRLDCNNDCGGAYREDFCGVCDDDPSNDNLLNGDPELIKECVIAEGADTESKCSGTMTSSDSNYTLVGKWDGENDKCYCRISDLNILSDCRLCIKAGSGDSNAGCD